MLTAPGCVVRNPVGTRGGVDDGTLPTRIERTRRRVAEQASALRDLRRRSREREARASARSDRAIAGVLRARGEAADPPVPAYPPPWLDDGA